jgi:hypothetical protein
MFSPHFACFSFASRVNIRRAISIGDRETRTRDGESIFPIRENTEAKNRVCVAKATNPFPVQGRFFFLGLYVRALQ